MLQFASPTSAAWGDTAQTSDRWEHIGLTRQHEAFSDCTGTGTEKFSVSQMVSNEKGPRAWNPRIISELLNDLVVIRDVRRKNPVVSPSAIEVSKVLGKTERPLPSREKIIGCPSFGQLGCL